MKLSLTVIREIFLISIIFFIITPLAAQDRMELGLEVYNNKAMCGTCHVLQAAKSEGQIGPNLDMLKPQISQIINAVTNGIGVMPPWGDTLTFEEIEAVAYYVFNSTNK
tara:strand:+ start:51 stop:377 length:327 start_codon:yes stop_codon:yes gene_type:complete